MKQTGLRGPFPLTEDGIDKNVKLIAPGTYVLGESDQGDFDIYYVGRSDKDVNRRLHKHEDANFEFMYEYYPSPKAAYFTECRLYHKYDPPANRKHPDRPDGTKLRCPVCGEPNY